jgi:hypothetical protein
VQAARGGVAVGSQHLVHGVVEPHLEEHLEVVGGHEHREMRQVEDVLAEQQHAVDASGVVRAGPGVVAVAAAVRVVVGHRQLLTQW